MLNFLKLNLFPMKKRLLISIIIIITALQLSAQKTKDVLYLKNGSMIYGKLIEIIQDQYKIQTSDGSVFIYKSSDVEKFAKIPSFFDGRRKTGFGFALEAGLLAGTKNSNYVAPFSFNVLVGITGNTNNITSIGSGVEFIGRPFTPLFIEYKRIIYNRKTSPFIFARGGALISLGGDETSSSYAPQDYGPKNYKGGASIGFGSGISWSKEDYEINLSFGYRYARTSYVQYEYAHRGDVTYINNLNRLEIKFGFRF
jgi:hypothetical protein